VGAGPYGLSLGAHLSAKGLDCRVFGQPMQTWRTSMPRGMHLKSDGFASNLSDPEDEFTLANYCAQEGLPYADLGLPVPIETFCAYGLAFQHRFVPAIDERSVVAVRRAPNGYSLELADSTKVAARRVVAAVGIRDFAYVPEVLADLPPEVCSHSALYAELDGLAGVHVAIVGAGASALDLAALLHRAGARVDVIARGPAVTFHDRMRLPRRLHERILAPTSGLGPGWRSRFYTDAAPVFHLLPERQRIATVSSSFGPVGGWFVRDDVVGKVNVLVDTTVVGAQLAGERPQLSLRDRDGALSELTCDRVIAATGYRVDLERVGTLAPELRKQIATAAKTPVLSAYFESSVPGLYFVGATAANSFGPMMRFAYGSRFVARRLSRHLARTSHR
jgi:thioredoxin reductase